MFSSWGGFSEMAANAYKLAADATADALKSAKDTALVFKKASALGELSLQMSLSYKFCCASTIDQRSDFDRKLKELVRQQSDISIITDDARRQKIQATILMALDKFYQKLLVDIQEHPKTTKFTPFQSGHLAEVIRLYNNYKNLVAPAPVAVAVTIPTAHTVAKTASTTPAPTTPEHKQEIKKEMTKINRRDRSTPYRSVGTAKSKDQAFQTCLDSLKPLLPELKERTLQEEIDALAQGEAPNEVMEALSDANANLKLAERYHAAIKTYGNLINQENLFAIETTIFDLTTKAYKTVMSTESETVNSQVKGELRQNYAAYAEQISRPYANIQEATQDLVEILETLVSQHIKTDAKAELMNEVLCLEKESFGISQYKSRSYIDQKASDFFEDKLKPFLQNPNLAAALPDPQSIELKDLLDQATSAYEAATKLSVKAKTTRLPLDAELLKPDTLPPTKPLAPNLEIKTDLMRMPSNLSIASTATPSSSRSNSLSPISPPSSPASDSSQNNSPKTTPSPTSSSKQESPTLSFLSKALDVVAKALSDPNSLLSEMSGSDGTYLGQTSLAARNSEIRRVKNALLNIQYDIKNNNNPNFAGSYDRTNLMRVSNDFLESLDRISANEAIQHFKKFKASYLAIKQKHEKIYAQELKEKQEKHAEEQRKLRDLLDRHKEERRLEEFRSPQAMASRRKAEALRETLLTEKNARLESLRQAAANTPPTDGVIHGICDPNDPGFQQIQAMLGALQPPKDEKSDAILRFCNALTNINSPSQAATADNSALAQNLNNASTATEATQALSNINRSKVPAKRVAISPTVIKYEAPLEIKENFSEPSSPASNSPSAVIPVSRTNSANPEMDAFINPKETVARYKKATIEYRSHLLAVIKDEITAIYGKHKDHTLFTAILASKAADLRKEESMKGKSEDYIQTLALITAYHPVFSDLQIAPNNNVNIDDLAGILTQNSNKQSAEQGRLKQTQLDIDLAIGGISIMNKCPAFNKAWEKYKIIKNLEQSLDAPGKNDTQKISAFHNILKMNKETLGKRRDSAFMTFAKCLGVAGCAILGLPLGVVGGAYFGYQLFFGSKRSHGSEYVNECDEITKDATKDPNARSCFSFGKFR